MAKNHSQLTQNDCRESTYLSSIDFESIPSHFILKTPLYTTDYKLYSQDPSLYFRNKSRRINKKKTLFLYQTQNLKRIIIDSEAEKK